MRVVALVEPGSLVGQGVREGLENDDDLDLRLLGANVEAFGTLAEVRGEAALVQPLTEEALREIDLAVLCGDPGSQAAALAALPHGAPALLVATDFDHPEGVLGVAGVNDDAVAGQGLVISPHPAVVLLAQLLSALAEPGPSRVDGTIVQPASSLDTPGLDELFEQARSILNFSGDLPHEVFGRQLAFNVLPGPDADRLGDQVGEVLGRAIAINVEVVQGSVFHGLAASLRVEFDQPVGSEEVARLLDSSPLTEANEDPDHLGPIDIAGSESIQLGRIRGASDTPHAIRLWATMDNLALGGTANALSLARQVLAAERT